MREDATVVDLTRSKVTVEMLTETKITCTSEEKVITDAYILTHSHTHTHTYTYIHTPHTYTPPTLTSHTHTHALLPPSHLTHTPPTLTSHTHTHQDLYLYYFLLLHPGRTIVFVNSIDCLQRVRAIFDLLGQRPLPLHAHMQQRQRLKNLDR